MEPRVLASGGLRRLAGDRTGLVPLGVVAIAAAAFSALFWAPFAVPAVYLRTALPAGNVVGSLALGALMIVFRRPLSAGIQRAGRALPAGARAFIPPIVATAFFLLSWAGSHVDRPSEVGLVPEIVFPASSAVFAFALARWNASIQRALDRPFAVRDRLRPRMRFVLALAVPAALSLVLSAWLGTANPARNAQLLVLIGMATGYLVLAPRAPRGRA